jgi:putative membrane protein
MKYTILGTALAPLFIAAPALAQQQPSPGCGPWGMWHYGWPGMFFGPLLMLLFFAGIVIAVAVVIRWLVVGGSRGADSSLRPPHNTPLDILKERFARGEIDKDEFEERRKVLER